MRTFRRRLPAGVLALSALTLAAFRVWRRLGAVAAPIRGSRQSLFHGQPAARAIVVLHPVNQSDPPRFPPRGVTGPDGAFVIGSRLTSDGAPAGEYAVTVVWPEEQNPNDPPENTPPDRLKNRYNDLQACEMARPRGRRRDNALETLNIE